MWGPRGHQKGPSPPQGLSWGSAGTSASPRSPKLPGFLEVLSLEGREFPGLLLWGNPPPAPGCSFALCSFLPDLSLLFLFCFRFFFGIFFFPPFGWNSCLILQLWQTRVLSQVSAFPSQVMGLGQRQRAREEGRRGAGAAAAAEQSRDGAWGTQGGRGPFSQRHH